MNRFFHSYDKVTGASTGFGRVVTEEVLKNGDIAVATLRKPSVLADLVSTYPETRLLVLPLEVCDKDAIHTAFSAATDKFGRVDIVFNNAGVVVVGEAEGVDEDSARKMFDTNFWGAAKVTLEAVRVFREVNHPRGGLILQNSSENSYAEVPALAHYCATKGALDAFSPGVATDVDPAWNIKFTIIQPGSFKTTIKDNMDLLPQHPACTSYSAPSDLRQVMTRDEYQPGDVVKAGRVIYQLASLPNPPLCLLLGKDTLRHPQAYAVKFRQDVETYRSWSDDVSR